MSREILTKKNWNPFQIYQFRFDEQGWLQYCLIPKKLETCPCCQSQLEIQETDEFYFDETYQVWLCDEIKVDCVRGMKCYKEFKNSEYWRMPYVYWLPVETTCGKWVNDMLKIYHRIKPIPQKWLERNGQLKLPFLPSKTLPVL
jgi:hypothetical protein